MLLKGNPVLIFGDLHYSAVHSGQHRDYFGECCSALEHISEQIAKHKPSGVIFLGDLIGWSESNIKDHQALHLLFKYFKHWNEACPVFSLVGNHDVKGHPDFNIMHDVGLFFTSKDCGGYIDYQPEDKDATIRLHLVDFGDEKRELDIKQGSPNLVLSHNAYTIQGITNWFKSDGYELGTMTNFVGCEGVIAGHIHTPSPDFAETMMPDGSKCWLFYPGCPTRPQKDTFDRVWSLTVGYNEMGYAEVTPEAWNLLSYLEAFFQQDQVVDTEDAVLEAQRKANLSLVLSDLLKYHIATGDPIAQVDKIPNATEGAKAVAKQYLELAINQGK